MLFVKQPGQRRSAFWDGVGSVALTQGNFVKMNGYASAALGPVNRTGGPRYAASGDDVVSRASGNDTVSAPVFPVKKYHFKLEDSDLTLDTLTSGEYLVYYDGGEYETDVYGSIASVTYGQPLYLDANGLLATGVLGSAIAIAIRKSSTFDSNYQATGVLWFRMAAWPYNLSGGNLA